MRFERLILIATLILVSIPVHAVSLGRLTVISDLDQPLIAEVDLLGVNASDFPNYSAQLASEQSYRIQGIEKTPPQNSIRAEVVRKPDNTPVLKLTSSQALHSPSVNILIQLDWPNGRIMREYALLLEPSRVSNAAPVPIDSVVFTKNRTSPPPETPSAPQETVIRETKTIAIISPEPKAVVAKPDLSPIEPEKSGQAKSASVHTELSKPEPQPVESGTNGYRAEKGDTLHKIATRMQVDGVSLDQMLQALYLANKDAFIDGDINKLKAGAELKSPSAADFAAATTPTITAQSDDWRSYRSKVASMAAESKASDEGAEYLPQAGKISKVEDKAAPVSDGPRDVLKLSRTDHIDEKWLNREAQFEQEKQALEEEVTVRDNRLLEANQRIMALEKQINDMNLLLEKSRVAMAQQQKSSSEPHTFTSTLREVLSKPSDGVLAAVGAVGLLLLILVLRAFSVRKTRTFEPS
jgi:pilus assembly protein FimV